MTYRRMNLNGFVLLVVVAAGLLCFQHSLRKSERLDHLRVSSIDQGLTTEARLLKGIPGQSSESHASIRLTDFKPTNASRCIDTPSMNETAYDVNSVERALGHRAAIAGFHNKTGMLSAIQWRPEFKKKRNIAASYWFASTQRRRARCMDVHPPFQFPGCTVLINHHYKFIWIRGTRVGSSAIERSLGWICSDNTPETAKMDKAYCSEALHDNEEVSMAEVQDYWDAYFVFAFIRNPYSRFASAYTYVSGLMGDCPKLINFSKLCDSPFLFAKLCSTLSCCWPGAITHHMHHAAEQSRCLFTETGDVAVDFIGQTESLNDDLQLILDEINRRAESHLPHLTIKDGSLPMPDALQGRRPLHLFSRNSTCLSRVEHYYWRDFDRMGYDRIAASV